MAEVNYDMPQYPYSWNEEENDDDMKECQVCGNRVFEDDIDNEICIDCLTKYATLENAIEYGKCRKEQVELNGFLFSQFTEREIEEILLKELKEYKQIFPGRCQKQTVEYCHDSKWDFAEFIKDKGV